MRYPEYANINGVRYKLRTDFRIALRCLEVVEDDSICDEERALAVIYLLFGCIPADASLEECLGKAKLFLQCGKTTEEQKEVEKDMDFAADMGYISASFASDYQIDLSTAKMHWWRFCELIGGLTESSSLSRVRELRNYDLSDVSDPKARAKIIKAKEAVALPQRMSAEERAAIEEFEKMWGG